VTSANHVDTVIESGSGTDDDDGHSLEQLYAWYTERSSTTQQKGKIKKELEPVMDDFINCRSRGFPCRRIPLNTFFENNKACKFLIVNVP
jgi:hypothetical protein